MKELFRILAEFAKNIEINNDLTKIRAGRFVILKYHDEYELRLGEFGVICVSSEPAKIERVLRRIHDCKDTNSPATYINASKAEETK